MYYIGLDLGTSGLKGLLVSEKGEIVREGSAGYPVCYPKSGWSEQNPEDWYTAAKKVLKELSAGVEEEVVGVSIGGQMHGLVLLDENDAVIRPAILWNDGRCEEQTQYLNTVVGKETLNKYTANVAFAGFTAPKILWVKEKEPQNFSKIKKLMLPKDYLAYRLTGVYSTDYSDASGMLLLDVKNKRWSKEMLELCSVKEEWLPKLYESYEVTGKVNLLPNAYMTAGAGDNAAAAMGTGTVEEGDCNLSLGTSGTVFIAGNSFMPSKANALHSFAHATGKWHLMGCILSAASANKWWLEEILKTTDYDGATKNVTLGEGGVYFLPYLMGERSPHNDVTARGAFLGLCANTTREEMCLSVLEGVSFALRDCVECAREEGLQITRATVCGGGAKSKLWRRILANVLNVEIVSLETEQGPSYGAAILAMIGTGRLKDASEAKAFAREKERISPEPDLVQKYQKKYDTYRKFYPALKGIL